MLHFEAAGAGPGLAFIHAGVADSRMWDADFAEFARRFRVVRMDLRGFGRSPLVPGRFSHRDDVAEALRAAGLERATLVGCSFGSTVAVETALAHPDLVEGLVLVSPSLGGGESEEMERFGEKEEALLERGDLDGATELNLRMWVDGPHRTPDQVAPELRERVRVLEAEVARREAEDLSPRLKSLEEERAALLEERRVVAKRVEDLIAKLGQLEKSLHA